MICLETVKRFCKEYWKIKNYQEAVNDTTQTWHCHHCFEIEYNLSKIELQALGFYFNRPFYELLFLTPEEHIRLHQRGKPKSTEWKQKISDANKGRFIGENNPMYGKGYLIEGEKNGMYGKTRTDESKAKQSATIKSKGGHSGENNPNYKYHITEEELYDLYIVQGLSRKQIAELYGCGKTCIHHKLKKYNISKHGK